MDGMYAGCAGAKTCRGLMMLLGTLVEPVSIWCCRFVRLLDALCRRLVNMVVWEDGENSPASYPIQAVMLSFLALLLIISNGLID